MFEFAMTIGESQGNSFQFFLEGGHLSIQRVDLALLFSPLTNFEGADLFGQHEHPIFGEGFGWVRGGVR